MSNDARPERPELDELIECIIDRVYSQLDPENNYQRVRPEGWHTEDRATFAMWRKAIRDELTERAEPPASLAQERAAVVERIESLLLGRSLGPQSFAFRATDLLIEAATLLKGDQAGQHENIRPHNAAHLALTRKTDES